MAFAGACLNTRTSKAESSPLQCVAWSTLAAGPQRELPHSLLAACRPSLPARPPLPAPPARPPPDAACRPGAQPPPAPNAVPVQIRREETALHARRRPCGLLHARLRPRVRLPPPQLAPARGHLRLLVPSMEATIIIKVSSGSWPKGFGGQLIAFTDSLNKEILLFDSRDKEVPLAGDHVHLFRHVVSVEITGKLRVSISVSDGILMQVALVFSLFFLSVSSPNDLSSYYFVRPSTLLLSLNFAVNFEEATTSMKVISVI
ncbi:hypothetical protein EJB05_37586, partial [Eragrostis curvula]